MGELITTEANSFSPALIDKAITCVEAGGVLVMPTDSVYGIGSATFAHNPGYKRVYEIKQRDFSQKLPWLVASPQVMLSYCDKNVLQPYVLDLVKAFWPGAFTIVVNVDPQKIAPEYLTYTADGRATMAFRQADNAFVAGVLDKLGALAVTSANIHGHPSAIAGTDIEQALLDKADLIVSARPAPVGVASTIVDGTQKFPRVLREGLVTRAHIAAAIGYAEEEIG